MELSDKPYILSIETATSNCSVAISAGDELMVVKEENKAHIHAEVLTLFIEDAVKEARITFKDLSAVCVSKGPGSYTGLRIGVSTAKGLCYALGIPLLSVNTLESMAWGIRDRIAKESYILCPVIDARRMEVYCMLIDSEFKVLKDTEAIILDEHSFDAYADSSLYLFGDAVAKCKDLYANKSYIHFIENYWPSASSLYKTAFEKYHNQTFEDLAYFEPYYLKEFLFKKKIDQK